MIGRELSMMSHGDWRSAEVTVLVVYPSGKTQRLPMVISDTVGTGVYEIDRYSAYAHVGGQYVSLMDGRQGLHDH